MESHTDLNNINKTKKWLIKELKRNNKDIEDILLATIDINDNVVFYERNKDKKVLNVLE